MTPKTLRTTLALGGLSIIATRSERRIGTSGQEEVMIETISVGWRANRLFTFLLGLLALTLVYSPAPAAASPSGVLLAGSDWLQGQGVDVHGNGGDIRGTYWQCVELPQMRLYPKFGWPRVYAADGGAHTIPEGSPGLERHDPGSGYRPVPGDLVIENATSSNAYGHVAVVDHVTGNEIHAVEQNGATNDGRHVYQYNDSNYSGGYGSVKAVLHAPQNTFKNPEDPGPAPVNADPIGALDQIATAPGRVHVSGWTFDPDDKTAPLRVDVYVGGPAGTGVLHSITANTNRPDVGATHEVGPNHGFDAWIDVDQVGLTPVYVYAINSTSGNNPELGHASIRIADASPVGSLDYASSPFGSQVYVNGWAADRDSPKAAIRIVAYVGGPQGVGEAHDLGPANLIRSDIAKAFPEFGAAHSFRARFNTAKTGFQSVYVYALNAKGTPGQDVLLEVARIKVTPPQNSLAKGQAMPVGAVMLSTSGKVRLVNQPNGNLVLYAGNRALWSSRTRSGPATLKLQSDGNLVLYSGRRAVWSTKTKTGTRLVVQDNGNLVLYSGKATAWASRTHV